MNQVILDLLTALLWQLIVPGVVLIIAQKGLAALIKYMETLWVTGKADEWVLVINNGKLKQAEIGLCTFIGPFDQVAKFPSTSQMVTFESEQVTSEMSGVHVKGMLIWTIHRGNEGPHKAFKQLGQDLQSNNPKTANNNLQQQAAAIIRNQIANSTLNEVLRNRVVLRKVIREEMQKVCDGWGVWLECVEITEVIISSNSVFKDLQADYRESVHRTAEMIKMKIASELKQFHEQQQVTLDRARNENNASQAQFDQNLQNELKDIQEKGNLEIAKIKQEKDKKTTEFTQFKSEQATEINLFSQQFDLKYKQESQKIALRRSAKDKEIVDANYEISKLRRTNAQAITQAQNDYDIQKKKLDNDVLRKALDKDLMLAKSLKAGVKVIKAQNVEELKFTNIDNSAQNQVLATAFAGFNAVRNGIQQE